MRKYEEYKHSGIDWIPTIPKNWKLRRVDEIAKIVRGNTAFKKDELLDIGKYVALQYGKTYKVDEVNQSFNFYVNDEFYKSNQTVKQGDTILISTSETIEDLGHTCYYNRTDLGLLGGEQLMLRPNTNLVSPKFLYYFSKYYRNEIKKYATGLKVYRYNIDDLKNIFIPVFSVPEQQTIANYLDAKTQAIDKKVTLLEQKIETYKKLKNTIIAKAVTQGISNQELSINDLGFKTPANWTKYRLKDLGKLFSGLSGKSGDDFNQEDNPNNRGFIPFTNIANNTYLKKDHLGTVVINPGEKQNKVRKGDLFFLMSSEGYGDIGKTAVLADDIDEAYLNSFCKGYRVNQNKCNPYFLNYLLLSNIYRQRLIVEGKGFTRINLKMEKVTDFEIFLPPTLSEQQEIANYIDHKTATIDAIVSNIGKQIDTLKQLRKTLINDVVTGKIKVIG